MEKSILVNYNELTKDATTEIAIQLANGVIMSLAFDRLLNQNEILIKQNNEILANLDVVRHLGISQEVSTAAAKQAKSAAKAPRSI